MFGIASRQTLHKQQFFEPPPPLKLKFSDSVKGLQIFIENKNMTDRQKCKTRNINMFL